MEQIKKEGVKPKSDGCQIGVLITFLSGYQGTLGDGAPVQAEIPDKLEYTSSTGTNGGDGFIYLQDGGPGLTLGALMSQLNNLQNQLGSRAMVKIQDASGTVWNISGTLSQEGAVIIGTDF